MPKSDGWFKPGHGPQGGRPAEHPLRSKVNMALLDAIVRLLAMPKGEAVVYMKGNPTMTEVTAWKYITEYPTEVIDRFCGRIPRVDGVATPVDNALDVTPREEVIRLLQAMGKPSLPNAQA